MNAQKLLIGKIPYANLFPAYYYLEKKCNCKDYTLIKGVPSGLNKMLRNGKIDVSPSSSIEYLRHRNKYSIIPFFSISSAGPVCSIFLFSKLPLEKLHRKTIAVSSHSDTSVVLLKIILKNFFSLNCKFISVKSGSLKKILNAYPACLLIGDEAMREAKNTVTRCNVQVTGTTTNTKPRNQNSLLYTYDLGDLWFKHTGLPFVFALWIVRKKSLVQKEGLVKRLSLDLIRAKEYASKNLSLIARQSPQRKWLSTRELVNYWKGISYDFTDKHMEGLRLFEKYAFMK